MDKRIYDDLAKEIDLLRAQIDNLVASKNTTQTRVDAILALLKKQSFGTPGLTIHGATKDDLLTAAAMDYLIDGVPYTLAITAQIVTTAKAEQVALSECWYLVEVDAAGTITFVKGVDSLTAGLGGGVAAIPESTASLALVGAVYVVLTNAATFTLGTTAFDAGDVASTYFDARMVTALAVMGSLAGAAMGDMERTN